MNQFASISVRVFQKHITVVHYRDAIHKCSLYELVNNYKAPIPSRVLTIGCKYQFLLCMLILSLPSTNAISQQPVLSVKDIIPNYASWHKL